MWALTSHCMVSATLFLVTHYLQKFTLLPADFHGYPGATFAIVSDRGHQLNAFFGTITGLGGTWMHSIGLKHGRDQVEVRSFDMPCLPCGLPTWHSWPGPACTACGCFTLATLGEIGSSGC